MKWIPVSFGFVDAVSGVGDLYAVIKNKKTDAASIALGISSIVRVVSSFYTVIDTVAKCKDWTTYNRLTARYAYKPIAIASVTSAVTLISLVVAGSMA
jgi:hypothetical protein